MKLLLINHFPLEGSGSGIYTKNIAAKMKDRGHKVKVLVVDNKKINDGYKFPVTTIFYPQFPCFTTHPKSNKTFYDFSREEMNEYFNIFKNTIEKEIKLFNPDLIHCQHLWIAPFVVSQTNVPYIVTAHGTDIKGFKKDKRYRHAALRGAQNAEKIVAISKKVREQIKKYYNIKEDKIKLIWNGFDEDLFYPMEVNLENLSEELLENKNILDTKHIISFVGKLTHFKGVDLLLEAGKIYEKKLNNVVTLISGDGELREELKYKAKKLNLENFYFLGNQPQENIAKINSISTISVVPSRDEPFGLVALEAMACGTPVIASETGGLIDFVNNDVGRLFPEGDIQSLTQSIVSSIKENDKEKKGKIAKKYAHNNFSWNKVVDELENLYKEILRR
ncbi:MAG: glycosyltransferase family 4 protein [Bacillota bacterium]